MPHVGVVAAATVLALGVWRVEQAPTFRSATDTVSIYATVVDAAGRLVPGLTKDDFTVFDNDQPQRISVFSNSVRPMTAVIMLDRSGSMRGNFDLEEQAAVQLVKHLLPADKVRIGSFSSQVVIEPEAFTSDQGTLLRILYEDLQGAGPTPLWGATLVAMSALARQDDRRIVVLLTDGYDEPAGSEPSFDDVRTRAEAEDIMVYGIGLGDRCGASPTSTSRGQRFQARGGGLGPRPRAPFPHSGTLGPLRSGACANLKPDPYLAELAAESGGGYLELQGADDLGPTVARVADELHRQYLLGFSALTLDGGVHRLTVQVRGLALTARARKTYIAR